MYCPKCGNGHVTQVAQNVYQCTSDPKELHKRGVHPGDLSCGFIHSADRFLSVMHLSAPLPEIRERGLPRTDLACPECHSTETRKRGQWVTCEECHYRSTEDYFFVI